MELLSGESLASRLSAGALSIREAVGIAGELLAALEMLHGQGLIHRDLKPSNVFLTPHGLKLLDFGLARPVAVPDEETNMGLTLPGMRGAVVDGNPRVHGHPAVGGAAFEQRPHRAIEGPRVTMRCKALLFTLDEVIARGFFCVPLFERDAWLDGLRREPRFEAAVAPAAARHRAAVATFEAEGGLAVLGIGRSGS